MGISSRSVHLGLCSTGQCPVCQANCGLSSTLLGESSRIFQRPVHVEQGVLFVLRESLIKADCFLDGDLGGLVVVDIQQSELIEERGGRHQERLSNAAQYFCRRTVLATLYLAQ